MFYNKDEKKSLENGNGPVKVAGNTEKDLPSTLPGIKKSDGVGEVRPATMKDVKTEDSGWANGFDFSKMESEVANTPSWDAGAKFGIRRSLENDFGVDGSRIGYENGNVTLDGKFLMKAKNNVDGTTYTDSWDSVKKSLSDFGIDNDVVAIRDYAQSSGTAVNIEWNDADKTVSVNGQTVKPAYVIDGKAYVPKSQIDTLLGVQKDTAGTSYGNIYNDVEAEHGVTEEAAFQEYMKNGSFSYVPENDPAYVAYMNMAKKAIEDEYASNMAAARFRTGGVGSTGQMLQAAAIREGAVNDLAAARAQFEDRAYQKYLDDIALDRAKFEVANGRLVDDYNLRAGVNQADKSDFYYGAQFDPNMRMMDYDLSDRGWQTYYYPRMIGNEMAISDNGVVLSNNDVATSNLDWKLYEQYGPRMTEIEAELAELGLGDAQVKSDIYREFARPTAEAEYYNLVGGIPGANMMPYSAGLPVTLAVPGATTVLSETPKATEEQVLDATSSELSEGKKVYNQLVENGLSDEEARVALAVMGIEM